MKPCKYGHAAGRNKSGQCKECRRAYEQDRPSRVAQRREYNRSYYAANQGKRRDQIRISRGLPLYTREPGILCECCGKPQQGRAMCLDHCHETGKFRGWLCNMCNKGIGQLGDNLSGLQNAVAYLERFVATKETMNE